MYWWYSFVENLGKCTPRKIDNFIAKRASSLQKVATRLLKSRDNFDFLG